MRKDLLEERRQLVKAYRDRVVASQPHAVRVNIEYEKTEQKRHQLLFRVPTLRVRPHPRLQREQQGQEPYPIEQPS